MKCAEQPGGAADGRNCTKEFGACLKEKISSRESRDPIRFEGGDGRSEKTAVVVLGALTNLEGVAAESLWIAKKHPGWRKNSQALIHNGPHSFDRIEYETPNGPGTIWFEISAFLGKGGLEQLFGEPKPK